MGILGRLFGRTSENGGQSAPEDSPATAGSTPDVTERIVSIGDTLYEVARSPNGRWVLGWSDATPDGHRMGARGGGRGAWILLEEGQERSRGRLERPNDGAVANDGRFVLPDWLFTDQLAGHFYAMAPDGAVLISERLGANVGAAAISPDGRTALVETLANPGDRTWSNLVICYDLDTRSRRWVINPPAGIVRVDFEDANQAVLHLRNDRTRAVSLIDGSLGAGTEERRTDNIWTAYAELEDEVREGLETADPEQLAAWLTRTSVLEPRFADYPNQRAKVLRIRGEVCEKLGSTTDAVAAYMAGLDLDPGLGVKRRLKALGAEAPAAPRRGPAAPGPVDDRPYASTECPSCGVPLSPLPRAKSKCKSCGNQMWVRGAPDGRRHILREDQLEAHQALWQEAYEAQEREEELAFERQRDGDRAAGLIVGLYDVDVVGESHYQDTLRRHAGPIGEWGAETSVIVELVREPNNRYDRNAVAVQLAGSVVGYLPREEAELVGPMLKSLERGQPCKARATIRGGSAGAPSFGISIDGIPDPYEFAGR
jgi:hypothetical protein